MRFTPIRWVITLVAVAVAAAIVGLIERLPFEEVHPLKIVVIETAFLAVPVAGAWLVTTRWRQLGIVALVATAASTVVSLVAALLVLGQGIVPDWVFIVHAGLLVAAGIIAWRLRDPLRWQWRRQPTVVYLLAATAVLLGEVLPRFDIVVPGETWSVPLGDPATVRVDGATDGPASRRRTPAWALRLRRDAHGRGQLSDAYVRSTSDRIGEVSRTTSHRVGRARTRGQR